MTRLTFNTRTCIAALPLLAGLIAAPVAFAENPPSPPPPTASMPNGPQLVSPGMATSAQVVVTPAPAVVTQTQVLVAPSPPPPPQMETVPAPPSTTTPVFWQPGHWNWTGSEWAWAQGQYVTPPQAQVVGVYVPGHWSQDSSGHYVWLEGYWKNPS